MVLRSVRTPKSNMTALVVAAVASVATTPYDPHCASVPKHLHPASTTPSLTAQRIRWFVGSSLNDGCLLSPANWSDITDGIVQCCNGVGFDATGAWVAPGKGFYGSFQQAGKSVWATVMAYGSFSLAPGICTTTLARKDEIAHDLLTGALASGVVGYNLDWEVGYNNSVECFVELWRHVARVLRPHGVQLGVDMDQSCLKLPGFPSAACGPTQWAYEWDYAPMIGAFDYLTNSNQISTCGTHSNP